MSINIPSGYKQTKVGVIPEDWEVVKLNEESLIQRGKFSPRPRNDPQYYNGKYPFVQTNEVVNSKGKISKYTQSLNDKGLKVSKLFPKGTILMTIAANIGFTGILEQDMACPDSLVGIECKKGLFNQYLNFYFIYNQKRIDYLSEEAAQKNINLRTLNMFKIPLPPLKEQQKIAQILTTWDDAISRQEELIEAKEKLKKGLMQKLLSGEVRFDGFDGEWEEVRLEEVLYIPKKIKPDIIDKNKLLSVKLHLKGVTVNKNTDSLSLGASYFIRDKGDFIFGKQNIFNGAFGIIPDKFNGYLSSSDVPVLSFKNSINSIYFIYFISRKDFFKKLENISNGTGSKRVHEKDLLSVKIKLPHLQEQQKIAQLFTTADKEIELLKDELDTLKEQKRGLMQRLLSGVVRVKV